VEINRALMPIVLQTGQPVFATACYAIIDTAERSLTYGNAGHPAPLVLRACSGLVDSLAHADPEPAAGLMEGFVYTDRQTTFGPGDVFLGYTDGLFEAANLEGVIYGSERLSAFLAKQRGVAGTSLLDGLVNDVVAFTGDAHFDDDICALIVEAADASLSV
jgi:sigma-B regulation protein RsbU (phosphoserine phosphatase)